MAPSDAELLDENTPLFAAAPLPIDEESIIQEEINGNGVFSSTRTVNGNRNGDTLEEDKPLPKLQIFLLCFARMVEPIAFFGIFPFIPQMIERTGNVEEADIGFYSGAIESAFSLAQMLLMISWGKAADRIGRKPVLVFSLSGVAVATAVFGLSSSLLQMAVLRCCAGIFAGTIVTVRTMLSENSTAKTQARAFSFFAFSGNLGIFLGPLIGGVFATPAETYPKIFGSFQFLKDFPYALPTFITGGIGASAAIMCGLLVKETLKRKDKNHPTVAAPMTSLEIIRSPGVGMVIWLYCQVMTLGLAYTALSTVFWYTKIESGGYGFTPLHNAIFLAAIGVSQSIWLLFIFPPLQLKLGTGGVLRICLCAWPVFFVSAPLCNLLLRRGWTNAFWIIAPILQIGGSGVAMAFTAVQLALNDISPSPQSLGTLNAIALTITAAIRTVGPAAFTSIFAAGIKTQFLNGYLVWVVLVSVSLVGFIPLYYLPEKAEGRVKKRAEENRDE